MYRNRIYYTHGHRTYDNIALNFAWYDRFFNVYTTCVRSARTIFGLPRDISRSFSHLKECVKNFFIEKFELRKYVSRVYKFLFKKQCFKKWKNRFFQFLLMKFFSKQKVFKKQFSCFFVEINSYKHLTPSGTRNPAEFLVFGWQIVNLVKSALMTYMNVHVNFKWQKNPKTVGNFF